MDMTMIRLFTRDQNYYRKEYDAAWSAQLLLNFRHHYQHKHYQLVRVKFFLGAIAHLSDQLMVITTRLQEVERRKQYKKRKRKKPYQQQLHKDRVF
jgi:FMN-dependent NADH-azoreductase